MQLRAERRRVAGWLVVAALMAMPFGTAAGSLKDARPVVDFIFAIVHMDEQIVATFRQSVAQESPQVQALVTKVIPMMDHRALVEAMAPEVAAQVSTEDLVAFRRFIDSEAGRAMAQAGEVAHSEQAFVKQLSMLPKAQQDALSAFYASGPLKRTMAAINSPRTHEAGRRFGISLVCTYARAHPAEMDIARLQASGACLN